GALAGGQRRTIGIEDDSPIRLRIKGQIYPGENATLFQRDFPHPITNIRGDLSADESGFYISRARATFGASENVTVSGYVKLAHGNEPLTIVFDAQAPELNINDWMEGWGTQPWAERPFVRPP